MADGAEAACGGVFVADARDAAAARRAARRRPHRQPERRRPARRPRPGGRRRRRRALALRPARRPPARPRRHAAARGVARHLAGPRRPRRRAAHLPQRLPLLLRRPGAGRPARGPVGQGRRLPPVVPARQLHDAHEPAASPTLERIEELRLSPLYVSLHAWDDDARVRLMGRAAARLARRPRAPRRRRPRPAPAGRAVSGMERRRRARRDRAAQAGGLEAVADLGVVPVSLAAEGDLRRVTAEDARRSSPPSRRGRAEFLRRRGTAFVHAADEFYLLAGEEPPPATRPSSTRTASASPPPRSPKPRSWRPRGRRKPAARRTRRHFRGAVAGCACSPATLAAAGARPSAASLAPAAASRCDLRRAERALRPARHRHRPARRRRGARRAPPRSPSPRRVARGPARLAPGRPGRTLDDVTEDELAVAAVAAVVVVADTLGDAFATLSR